MPDNWPLKPEAAGKWYLLIYRDDWPSDDLSELEERLYNFRRGRGLLRRMTWEQTAAPVLSEIR
jgi:hypothetical protein